MAEMSLRVNGVVHRIDVDPSTPLLWVLRDQLGLTGTRFGCGVAACGACTIHIDGEAVRCCTYQVRLAEGKEITTIEGLSRGEELHPLQQAWIDQQVPQCGYCQPGMLMASAALLKDNPQPSRKDIETAVTNICRCGTYPRIRKAIQSVAGGES